MNSWKNTNKIYQFFHWWKTGLSYYIPVHWREMIWPSTNQIHVSIEGEELLLSLISHDKPTFSEKKCFNFHDKYHIQNTLQDWLAQQQNTLIYGVIPNDMVLTRSIVLPINAMDNIEDILAFELERKTPFKKAQIYFDYTIDKDKVDSQHSNVILFMSLREKVDAFLAKLNDIDIAPDALTHNTELSINLLPKTSLPIKRNHASLTLSVASIVCFLCFIAALYLPLLKMEHDIETLEAQFNELRTEALALAQEEKAKENRYQRQNFLKELKNKRIDELELIKSTTEILPDDTYLTRYIHKQGELQLQGESTSASDLIEKLENSPHFNNTQFRSAITKNIKTNKERFHIISETQKVEQNDDGA